MLVLYQQSITKMTCCSPVNMTAASHHALEVQNDTQKQAFTDFILNRLPRPTLKCHTRAHSPTQPPAYEHLCCHRPRSIQSWPSSHGNILLLCFDPLLRTLKSTTIPLSYPYWYHFFVSLVVLFVLCFTFIVMPLHLHLF